MRKKVSFSNLDQNMADALVAKGEAALAEKCFEEAVQLLTEVSKTIYGCDVYGFISKLESRILPMISFFLILSHRMYLLMQAIALNENDPKAYLQRAKAHCKLENHLEAVSDAQQAAELDPKLAPAHAELGRALYALDEYESAKESFEMACVLEPTRKIHKNWVNMCKVGLGQELAEESPAQLAQLIKPEETRAPTTPLRKPTSTPAAASAGPTSVKIDDPEFSKYWSKPVAAVAALQTPQDGAKYRHQWFQAGDKVEVNVLAKGIPKDRVEVQFESRRLKVITKDAEGSQDYVLDVDLYGEIDPGMSKYSVLGSKIEVRLAKAGDKAQWPTLEAGSKGKAEEPEAAPAAPVEKPTGPTVVYPYAG